MMYNTNILVLVYENYRNRVVIWDNQEKRSGAELILFENQIIINLKLRKDLMVVVLKDKALIYDFVSLKQI